MPRRGNTRSPRRAGAVDPHASELRHRLREPGRRLRQAGEPGLRQGAAARFVEQRREKQALAGARAGARADSGGVAKEPSKPKEPAKPPVVVAEKAPEKPAADSNAEVLKAVKGGPKPGRRRMPMPICPITPGLQDPRREARPAWRRRGASASPHPSRSSRGRLAQSTLRGNSEASVTFRQNYRSDKLTSSNTKTLELVKADGRWQIRKRSGQVRELCLSWWRWVCRRGSGRDS